MADAPIGVALPPISVPSASVHARTDKSAPDAVARLLMIGIIVAENGTRNPSVSLLKRLAEGMGMVLKIEFIPKQKV